MIESGATAGFYENDLGNWFSLDGDWEFGLDGETHASITVPSAWEATRSDKLIDGPGRYTRRFTLPGGWDHGIIVLEAHAISFDAVLYINGQSIGEHLGMWSRFQTDITPFLRSGENAIVIEVWKPGQRYPLHESLAGFLPDVATTFGGIWQSIGLRYFRFAIAHDVRLVTDHQGRIDASGRITMLLTAPPLTGTLTITLRGHCVTQLEIIPVADGDTLRFAGQCTVAGIQPWMSQSQPILYDATLSFRCADSDSTILQVTRRIGFRDLSSANGRLYLNHEPLHLRGILDWGWHEHLVCPAPSNAQVLDQIAKARSLGFNLIKLCLFVPDDTTFNVADEQGFFLWLEMPMWLPHVTPAFRELAMREYRDVLARVHHHPSVVIVSLGCELDIAADAMLLHDLSQQARLWLPHTMQCDNSGSAEAYGGEATPSNDFHDYHFYTDPHVFGALVDHFTRSYYEPKPWIYGEFCDADTLRDFSSLQPQPWWLNEPLPLHRNELSWTREYQHRLLAAGVTDNGAKLTGIARRQATEVRKYIVEQVRSRNATGGYVITGWKDTPISTSGIVDDSDNLKFDPEEWLPFNQDCVLVLDRERRRKWTHGGDRPVHTDPFTCWQGENIEAHIAISNGRGVLKVTQLHWVLSLVRHDGEEPVSSGTVKALITVDGGTVSELSSLHLAVPVSQQAVAQELCLRVEVDLASGHDRQGIIRNRWRLWAIPLKQQCIDTATSVKTLSLESMLDQNTVDRMSTNPTTLMWLKQPDERLTRHLPFWREAIHVLLEHEFWMRVPQGGFADMRFFGVATDFAIDPVKLQSIAGPGAVIAPIWRRFDARAMTWADYLVELRTRQGRLFISTLRFEGGLGYEPDTFDTNPMGTWMLNALLSMQA